MAIFECNNKLTCHTPTTAFAIKISKITKGSTNASTPSCSSKSANTYKNKRNRYEKPRLKKLTETCN
jgi:hypothetical protein